MNNEYQVITSTSEPESVTAATTAVTSTAVSPETAGQLYAGGKSVLEVAQACGVTYGKARRLIRESGTPIRDASSRLKGRTRRPRSAG